MQRSSPLVSIIIPVYGRHSLVKEAIDSVLNQRKVDKSWIELVVSDDEDSADKRKLNKRFFEKLSPQLIYAENVYKEGPGGNRQSGLAKAKGKYIVFLDSDDRLKPDFVSEMLQILKEEKDKAAAICLSRSSFDSGFRLFEKLKLYQLMLIRDLGLLAGLLFNKKCIYPSSFYLCQISHMMFRLDAVKDQRFNYDYRYGGEDWDFFVQTLKRGKIRVIPKRLLLFRYSPGSSTDDPQNRIKKWKSYTLLADRVAEEYKRGMFYKLFLKYIKIFGGKNAKKK